MCKGQRRRFFYAKEQPRIARSDADFLKQIATEDTEIHGEKVKGKGQKGNVRMRLRPQELIFVFNIVPWIAMSIVCSLQSTVNSYQ